MGRLVSTFIFSMLCFGASLQAGEHVGGWEEIPMASGTACSRGGNYSIFVSPGTSNRVVIDFMGGGACWNAETCSKEGKTFIDSVEEFKEKYRNQMAGVYDRQRDDNPLKSWNHVIVPYCTGDIHWGQNEQTYTKKNGSQFVIKHQGAVNAKATMEWVREHYAAPEQVFVTGCSAGAYGSIFWLPQIRKMYPKAVITQFADSGASPITESFAKVAFKNWNVKKAAPDWIPGLDPNKVNWEKLQMPFLYEQVANFYPDVRFSQFTSAFDGVQRFFYLLMGGEVGDWPSLMAEALKTTASKAPNSRYFVSPGNAHCVLPYNEFYSLKSTSGVPVKDWLMNYISGQDVQNQNCENCTEDENTVSSNFSTGI